MRLLGLLLTVMLAIGAAVLTWPQFFRLEQTWPITQIVSFRGIMVVVFAALLLLCLAMALVRPLRGFAMSVAVVCVLGGVFSAGTLVVRGFDNGALPVKTETGVRVMTWNTAGSDATSAEAIAQTAVAMEADIVTLPETTIETGEAVAIAMREMGHPMWAHHATYGPWDADSTTLLITPELGDYAVIDSSQDGSSNTSTVPSAVAMPVDGAGPTIVAAHAVAPRRSEMQEWRDDLDWLADQCASESVIMAGDFNATVDHMARLGVDGATMGHCHDAAVATGTGAVGTWPTDVSELVGAPIDHVMATAAWDPVGSVVLTALDDVGSDHRPLIVQYEPNG